MSIKNIATSKRGPGRSPGKILKIYECSNFFDPPSLGFETFLTPPFWKLKTFLTPPFWSIKTFLTPPPRYLWTFPYWTQFRRDENCKFIMHLGLRLKSYHESYFMKITPVFCYWKVSNVAIRYVKEAFLFHIAPLPLVYFEAAFSGTCSILCNSTCFS